MSTGPVSPDGREFHLEDFRPEVIRRMRRADYEGPIAEAAARRAAQIAAQLPGQGELDLFGTDQP